MLRRSLLALSRSGRVKQLVTSLPVSSSVVTRFVAGEATDDAVRATKELIAQGLHVSLDHLGEDTKDPIQADGMTRAYLDVLADLSAAGLSERAEVSVKLSAVGQALPGDGERIALDNARRVCTAARTPARR